MKTVLITGAAGFIGTHLVKAFLDKGWKVVGIDDLNNFTYSTRNKYDRLAFLGINNPNFDRDPHTRVGAFDFYKVDVCETPIIKAMIIDGNYDLIIHLAGLTSVTASSLSPFVFFDTIVKGFENVIDGIRDICREHRPRFLFASSAAVYGNTKGSSLVENDKNLLHPNSIYGACKCMTEDAAETYAKLYDVRSVALRFFNIYGPFMRPDTLFNIVADSLYSGSPIPVYGDARHDFMYIDDCVKAILKIALEPVAEETPFEALNIGTADPISVEKVVRTFEKESGRKAQLRREDVPNGEIQNLTADITKFREQYDLKPQITFEEGVKRYFEWFIEYNKDKYDFSC